MYRNSTFAFASQLMLRHSSVQTLKLTLTLGQTSERTIDEASGLQTLGEVDKSNQ